MFRQTAPDRLELKKGGGCIGCFGIPFFLAGLFILLMSMQIIPVSNANDVPWWVWIIMCLMGLVFTGVGTSLVWGRSWITINKGTGTVWTAWGLLKPMWGNQYSLENYNKVILSLHTGDSDSPDTYPVALKPINGSANLAMCSSTSYGNSLQQAMQLASFLNLPLEDLTTDHPVIINHEDPQTAKPTFLQDPLPVFSPRPDMMKCDVTEDDTGLHIKEPGPAFSSYHLIWIVFPVLILLFLAIPLSSFFRSSDTPQFVTYFFLGFIGIFFVLIPLLGLLKAYLLSRTFTTFINVNPQGIKLEHRKLSKRNSLSIPIADIISIDYGTRQSTLSTALDDVAGQDNRFLKMGGVSAPYTGLPWWLTMLQRLSRSKGVIIKSRQGIYSFGQGLPDEEVYYLYTLVINYLNHL